MQIAPKFAAQFLLTGGSGFNPSLDKAKVAKLYNDAASKDIPDSNGTIDAVLLVAEPDQYKQLGITELNDSGDQVLYDADYADYETGLLITGDDVKGFRSAHAFFEKAGFGKAYATARLTQAEESGVLKINLSA